MRARIVTTIFAAAVALSGCARTTPVQTAQACGRPCPSAKRLGALDCCRDATGDTWSTCAWKRVHR